MMPNYPEDPALRKILARETLEVLNARLAKSTKITQTGEQSRMLARLWGEDLPCPPAGYRLLKFGEIIEDGDLYFSTSGKWEHAPVTNVPVINNNVNWARFFDKGRNI